MAGLLTPTAIWKNFSLDKNVSALVLKEETLNEYTLSHLKIAGREIYGERVDIYAKLVRLTRTKHAPVIIIATDAYNFENDALTFKLAKKGFICLTVDYAGEACGKEYFTRYPEKISYANVNNVDLNTFEIKEDYINSNWFEWDCVIKSVFYYALKQNYTNGVGFLGVNDGATVIMHVIATEEENVGCAALVGGSGWQAYKGIDKYGDTPEPHFNDDTLKYIASVESESYSKWVKCPLLMLVPTNSNKYDSDRAYDTVSRIDESVYTAFNLSPLRRDNVDYQSYYNAETFLSKFLLPKNSKTVLPGKIQVKAELQGKEIVISVMPDTQNLKDVELYVSEEVCPSSDRSFKKRSTLIKKGGGAYYFSYRPYGKSKRVFFFAKAIYKNKFSVCSPISVIKFEESDVVFKNKSVILYSSRIEDSETAFAPLIENVSGAYGFSLDEEDLVEVLECKNETVGISCKNGLITFRVSASKYKPKEDAILMFDVYVKEAATLRVSLTSKTPNGNITYSASVKVIGEVWQNVKLYKNSFKTKEGVPIKEFSSLVWISFDTEDGKNEFLINNALWV
jgi:hypothetical protein